MPASDIVVKGAREHNLRSIDLVLPRNKLICLTGVSGSGKSSLAFDTLYAEGQRRYVESLSSFARQFLGQMPKPEVDFIGGLSPSISISQKSAGNNPRSTVGTITEIYDFLRVLYARVGQGHCPRCGREIASQSREQIIARVAALAEGTRYGVLAPLIRGQKGEYRDLFEDLRRQGFVRARVDGEVVQLNNPPSLDRQMRHDIEVVVDRLQAGAAARPRLAEAVDLALKLGKGTLFIAPEREGGESPTPPRPDGAEADVGAAGADTGTGRGRRGRKARVARGDSRAASTDLVLSVDYACGECGLSFSPPSPQLFSFNSPQGMCPACDGLGEIFSFDPELLVPDPDKTFKQGAVELVGPWNDMGRWRRHLFQGMADTMERVLELPEGTLLETPWRELSADQKKLWLWGCGNQHITFTWRQGASPVKYGGEYEGLIPELLSKYRQTTGGPHLARLEKYMRTLPCPDCEGERLTPQARHVRIRTAAEGWPDPLHGLSLPEVCKLPVRDAARFCSSLDLDPIRAQVAAEALKEIRARLGFLLNVGLDYLTLDRTAPTLSGGESQRIRLASQIGSGLVGVLYILDEPSIGLHPRDNDRLLDTLRRLRDLGNTVVVVEHDEDTIRIADHVVDFGPGPGVRGGKVVAEGPPAVVAECQESVTGGFLSGRRRIEVPATRRPGNGQSLVIRNARHNNLRGVDIELPLGKLICVTGVSGSGKSSFVNDILIEALRRDLNGGDGQPGLHDALEGLEHLDKMIAIDQSPIGRTPRSNPATYIKLLDDIRSLLAQLPDSKARGYAPGRFSFNVSGGRCEACEGNGSNKLEMDFLADIWVTCPVCEGRRFNRETLQIRFKEKSIAEILDLDVQQAVELFENQPSILHKLRTLHDVGLDYMKLGQPSPTLSGGEAQRVKLARELVKRSTGKTLYLLDEPTTGLHFADIELLLRVLHGFVELGNTVVVVEHNLDVIKTADWLVDLGPEGGAGGGRIVFAGTPDQICESSESHTGRALARHLAGADAPFAPRQGRGAKTAEPVEPAAPLVPLATHVRVEGARQHNLKEVDVALPRDKMTVFCGPSGSGKSSLAMDTIYAEGQRRYVESLSAYARQFVGQMQKPLVERVEGLSPAIAIEQKNLGHTPRSTVGTVTEIYDYLRILFARLGQPHCPECDVPIGTQTTDEVIDKVAGLPADTRIYLMAPVEPDAGQTYPDLWRELRNRGYQRIRIDGRTHPLESPPEIDRRRKHQVEVVVDRAIVRAGQRSRLADSIESALSLGRGVLHVALAREDVEEPEWEVVRHSQHLVCEQCGRSFEPLSPHNFSFNSPLGWCSACEGLGTQTGANPAALIRDPKLTLSQGAVLLWPSLERPLAARMLEALARDTHLSLDVPFEQLEARQRRMLYHGSGDRWHEVAASEGPEGASTPQLRFQFKGLYPALADAARLSPALRSRLEHLVDVVECSACGGSRLRDDASASRFRGQTIDQLGRMPLGQLNDTIQNWRMAPRDRKIAGELIREIRGRLQFLIDVGLDYLTLARGAATLSNGEAQRIRLASQLGSGLCGVLYVLDEPTIGLHPRDNLRLLAAMHKLRDLGNTLLVVEHDREVIAGSDLLCDFGPRAGRGGGRIVGYGTPDEVAGQAESVTGPYLAGTKSIPVPAERRTERPKPLKPAAKSGGKGAGQAGAKGAKSSTGKSAKTAGGTKVSKTTTATAALPAATLGPDLLVSGAPADWLVVRGARHHNLKNIDVSIPLGTLSAVTGPSGSGKSSLVGDILFQTLAKRLHRASAVPGAHDSIAGLEFINKVIRVDQQPLGNSPASNPATYTGLFELIRELFAQLPESRLRGYSARRFSFNVPGGRCEECEGNGQLRIEMHFLPDVWVPCSSCEGKRYNPETLAVTYQGRSINDLLETTCGEALALFENVPRLRRILQTLCDVGLDYLTLGQAAPTLSGGEAQRVKLAAELSRPDTGRTLYLLDEPTTGLHFDDLARLLEVLQRLVDIGNTVVVIEHNLDIIKACDWLVDMGPEAGERGGQVVVAGTPEEVVEYATARRAKDDPRPRSHTGEALAPVLKAGQRVSRPRFDPLAHEAPRDADIELEDVGRGVQMPWQADGRRWHTHDRVNRQGKAVHWEGAVLEHVVDRIHELGEFNDTRWDSRSVVEIAATTRSRGWFFHAITAETWLVRLKFRVPRGVFKQAELSASLGLRNWNELDDAQKYGNEPRVRVRSQGAWQEVQVDAWQLAEIQTPAFDEFLQRAVDAYLGRTQQLAANPDEAAPWRKLGQKWHFLRKGFSPGKQIQWDEPLLPRLHQLLVGLVPDGEWIWTNQRLVHLTPPGAERPWATLVTKQHERLTLSLTGPKGVASLGRIADLGLDREFDARPDRDVVVLHFRSLEDLARGDLEVFLEEHLRGSQETAS